MELAKGVEWVVQKVLNENMRIDRRFVETLQNGRRRFWRRGSCPNTMSSLLIDLAKICQARRAEQREASMTFAQDSVKLFKEHTSRRDDLVIEHEKTLTSPQQAAMPSRLLKANG